MAADMTVPCGEGYLNIRVGAIIMREGKVLMVGSGEEPEYYYSVGGRLHFGETAEEAIVREVYEETGAALEIDRLGFVLENYFTADYGAKRGKLIYELSFFYYMKTPEGFDPPLRFREGESEETLYWVDPSAPVRYYPEFFRTELSQSSEGVKVICADER